MKVKGLFRLRRSSVQPAWRLRCSRYLGLPLISINKMEHQDMLFRICDLIGSAKTAIFLCELYFFASRFTSFELKVNQACHVN